MLGPGRPAAGRPARSRRSPPAPPLPAGPSRPPTPTPVRGRPRPAVRRWWAPSTSPTAVDAAPPSARHGPGQRHRRHRAPTASSAATGPAAHRHVPRRRPGRRAGPHRLRRLRRRAALSPAHQPRAARPRRAGRSADGGADEGPGHQDDQHERQQPPVSSDHSRQPIPGGPVTGPRVRTAGTRSDQLPSVSSRGRSSQRRATDQVNLAAGQAVRDPDSVATSPHVGGRAAPGECHVRLVPAALVRRGRPGAPRTGRDGGGQRRKGTVGRHGTRSTAPGHGPGREGPRRQPGTPAGPGCRPRPAPAGARGGRWQRRATSPRNASVRCQASQPVQRSAGQAGRSGVTAARGQPRARPGPTATNSRTPACCQASGDRDVRRTSRAGRRYSRTRAPAAREHQPDHRGGQPRDHPPASRLTRGPNASAAQPTSGDPIGAPPRKTSMYRPMTRPRISAVVPSWVAEFRGGRERQQGQAVRHQHDQVRPEVRHQPTDHFEDAERTGRAYQQRHRGPGAAGGEQRAGQRSDREYRGREAELPARCGTRPATSAPSSPGSSSRRSRRRTRAPSSSAGRAWTRRMPDPRAAGPWPWRLAPQGAAHIAASAAG